MPSLTGPICTALLVSGASTACGFAAVGVALYPHPAQMLGAAALFAGIGFVTGALRMALPLAFDHLPAQARLAAGQAAADAPSPLAQMAAATWQTAQASASRRPASVPAGVQGTAPAAPASATAATDTVGA